MLFAADGGRRPQRAGCEEQGEAGVGDRTTTTSSTPATCRRRATPAPAGGGQGHLLDERPGDRSAARRVNDLVTIRVIENIVGAGTADSSLDKNSSAQRARHAAVGPREENFRGRLDVARRRVREARRSRAAGRRHGRHADGADDGAGRGGAAERRPGARRRARDRHQRRPADRRADRRRARRRDIGAEQRRAVDARSARCASATSAAG